MTRPYKYGELAEIYAILTRVAQFDLPLRLLPGGAGVILRELEHLQEKNRALAEKLTAMRMGENAPTN